MYLLFPAVLNANSFNLSKPTHHRFPRWHSRSQSRTHPHSCVLNCDGIKLKTCHCRCSNLLYSDRSEILVLNEKKTSMSQIKPSPVADFCYETKVGFRLGGTRPLTSPPRPKQNWGLVAHSCLWRASGRFPTNNRSERFSLSNHPLLEHL